MAPSGCTGAPRSREDPTTKFSAAWTTPLPSPLSGDHRRLSPEARTEIRALIRPRPIRFLVELALAWLTIAGFVSVGLASGSILVSAAAIVLVATRQLLLGFLTHEHVHDRPCHGAEATSPLTSVRPSAPRHHRRRVYAGASRASQVLLYGERS